MSQWQNVHWLRETQTLSAPWTVPWKRDRSRGICLRWKCQRVALPLADSSACRLGRQLPWRPEPPRENKCQTGASSSSLGTNSHNICNEFYIQQIQRRQWNNRKERKKTSNTSNTTREKIKMFTQCSSKVSGHWRRFCKGHNAVLFHFLWCLV